MVRVTDFASYLRSLVIGVNTRIPLIDGKYTTAINFDNAATTPPFHAVMKEIEEFVPWYSSVHRGTGYKSILTSNIYEAGRDIVKRFVKADPVRDTVIFTKSTTEAINILAYKLAAGDTNQMVLSTDMEHLANDLPWRYHSKVDYVKIDRTGHLSLEDLEAKLVLYKGKVKLVTVTGASNVTGFINPIYEIARIAHRYGAKILVDGAQWVPHCVVDLKPCDAPEHIDFLAFSAHKMYAPFGAGVLIGPKELFQQGLPMCKGGGAVTLVTRDAVDWEEAPFRDEAGTPNALGVAAMLASIRVLQSIGMNKLFEYEKTLIDYAITGLRTVSGVQLYGSPGQGDQHVSLVSFHVDGMHHRLVSKILSYEAGIAVRSGLFCAHPYVQKLLKLRPEDLEYCHAHPDAELPGLVRISLGLYNHHREIDKFIDVLSWVVRNSKQLQEKYSSFDERTTPSAWMLKPIRKETP
jgi:selenocysteine lyase/cysteine desulfurase